MLFVACLRSPVLYFATQQSVEKNPEKKAHFWVGILIYLALSKCASGVKQKNFFPNNTACQKWKLQLLSRVNTTLRGCSSPAQLTGQIWALSLHWAVDGRAMTLFKLNFLLSALAAGSLQLLGQLPTDGRAAAVSSSDPQWGAAFPRQGLATPSLLHPYND